MLIAVIALAVTVTNGGVTHCTECDGTGLIEKAACEACEGKGEVEASSRYFGTIVTIAPPIIAILLALITKEVYSSLFIGIVLAALFATQFNVVNTIDTVVNVGLIAGFAGNAGIFIFLIVLGVMVALINKAGGSAAFGAWAKTHIKSKIGAEIATFVLGVLIFIDDYFNCLTVGSVMRPVTDSKKISRAKLAYLIDATAAPVCMIAPVSSWAAAVAGYAAEGEGIALFIKAIPFNFYSLLTFIFIITITLLKFDYGPMTVQNKLALEGKEETVDNDTDDVPNVKGKVIDLIFPVLVLIVTCVVSLLYVGGLWSGEGMSIVDAFGNTDATVGLPMGGLLALVITIIYYALRKVVSFKESMERIPAGFNAMVPAILILLMATSLKNIANDVLGINVFVDAAMKAAAPGLASFLPAVIFLVACVLAFATGTSWGTFGILIPIVTIMFPQGSALLTIGMSACLAGAVCGDHCSPISDTTIMSSAGARCNHLNHVSTQLPYAISVAVVSFVGYLLTGFEVFRNWFLVFPILVVITVGGLVIAKKLTAKQN
ncbi:MAG: Na+/H+ antiporter NhaC family protein [Clostridia bacterium]|nr:Na+/H+ antiporter NhaC family protein [Clostridia bacterium]